jgi:hypothetical protein
MGGKVLYKLNITHEGLEYVIQVRESDDLKILANDFGAQHDLTRDATIEVYNALVETDAQVSG